MALDHKPGDTPKKQNSEIGAQLCAPSVLFDDREIAAKIVDAVTTGADPTAARKAVSDLLAQCNQTARAALRDAYLEHPKATGELIRSYTYLTDKIVSAAFDAASQLTGLSGSVAKADQVSLVAVGGYGRGEMAPFSDVDLLFLIPSRQSQASKDTLETLLYILWDMKLKVGHSTRTSDECVKLGREDQTIKTALLESRIICGAAPLYTALKKQLWSKLFKGSDSTYIEQKLEERDERHARQGGARYVLEPNVKEGKGGLRDLQTMFWMTKHIAHTEDAEDMIAQGYFTRSEYNRFLKAQNFLWTVRCHLHLVARRATEQLTFDAQVEIAQRLKTKRKTGMRQVEVFMQEYFRHATLVGELTRIFLTKLEEQHVKQQPTFRERVAKVFPWQRSEEQDDELPAPYRRVNGRLDIGDRKAFLSDPLNMMRLFQLAMQTGILIHPDAMRCVTANLSLLEDDAVRTHPEAQRIFMSLLLDFGDPVRAMRRMNELGVVGAFIPEFKRIVALMQFNIYHHYTVDEHTIQCISVLAQLEAGSLKEELPVVSSVLEDGIERRVLYIALLIHDMGKGLPEAHEIAGEKLAEVICPRLGMSEDETKEVAWLVRNHLIMSDVAQKRDLSDPRTVAQFVEAVKSTKRLNLLTALTVCDIRGVGPGTWNLWKAQLLRELYWATRNMIKRGTVSEGMTETIDEAKAALHKALADWPATKLQAEIARHYNGYWRGLEGSTHQTFARLLDGLGEGEVASEIKLDTNRDATLACFAMADHPGLFARLTGALAIVGANIVDARTYTSSDGYATLAFWLQDADGKPYEASRHKRLKQMIHKSLMGEIVTKSALKERDKIKKRERDIRVPTTISFDNLGSERYSIIEVDTRDRPGLLYDLALTLRNANISVASAVIATYGAQVVDVFYVKDMFGTKIHSEAKQKQIAEKLRIAVERGAEGALS